ncbi:GNAT family N-acetyltransferase [Fulvivirga sp. 29W222]|uniref:GNAT family N-acetyltransferase n=1 Tax=Fulvivirga marina TaxID=2494733 RepID=A0A937G3A3_9BACT|nr:GNAT family N-acetyltransferase [Fulvivirga marina]MBL6449481.1 GNAT family N-acetyltransferase [Fulvivirga marina]
MLNLPENFETERLVIRRLRWEDAPAIYDGYASIHESTRFVSWPTHQSIEDTYSFLSIKEDDWKHGKDYAYGITLKTTGKLIGGLGAINEQGKVAIGYILNKNFEGEGYTTEAVAKLVKLLNEMTNVWRIWALCDVDNIGSHRVLEKNGFKKEGVLQRWFRFVNQNNAIKDCIFYLYLKP